MFVHICRFHNLHSDFNIPGQCEFAAVTQSNCPSNPWLAECTSYMDDGELCEADSVLPDGTTYYNINNCGSADVFKCVRSKHNIVQTRIC